MGHRCPCTQKVGSWCVFCMKFTHVILIIVLKLLLNYISFPLLLAGWLFVTKQKIKLKKHLKYMWKIKLGVMFMLIYANDIYPKVRFKVVLSCNQIVNCSFLFIKSQIYVFNIFCKIRKGPVPIFTKVRRYSLTRRRTCRSYDWPNIFSTSFSIISSPTSEYPRVSI